MSKQDTTFGRAEVGFHRFHEGIEAAELTFYFDIFKGSTSVIDSWPYLDWYIHFDDKGEDWILTCFNLVTLAPVEMTLKPIPRFAIQIMINREFAVEYFHHFMKMGMTKINFIAPEYGINQTFSIPRDNVKITSAALEGLSPYLKARQRN